MKQHAMGVAFRVLSKMKVIPGTVVFVSGAGPIGLGVISLLKYFGFYVVVSEPGEYRRNFAKNIALADIVLNPLEQDVKTVLGEMTQNMGPEYIIECSGSGKAQQQALELVRCQGTVIFAGENHEQINICPSEHIIHKEINLTGAFYYTVSDFNELIAIYNRGFRSEHLISHRIESSEAPEGFIKFFAGETGKVAITW